MMQARSVDDFVRAGFFPKAVAVLKKTLRVRPARDVFAVAVIGLALPGRDGPSLAGVGP